MEESPGIPVVRIQCFNSWGQTLIPSGDRGSHKLRGVAKNTMKSHVSVLSRFSHADSVTLWTVARQAPLSMGFSRQENWSGLPFPSPGERPDSGIEPVSPATPSLQMSSLPLRPQGNPNNEVEGTLKIIIIKMD